ncbi:MAG: DCC1-like thiol-disulfide oxidoreductase family protein [Bryobacteraceae bacterium]
MPFVRVFYDGHCALCHRAVRILLWADRSGDRFRFAPIAGPTWLAEIPVSARGTLPDSIVVLTKPGGQILVRSDAVLYLLRQLGSYWRGLAALVGLVPRPIRDTLYQAIARTRYRVFGRADSVCPVLPKALRRRFDP